MNEMCNADQRIKMKETLFEYDIEKEVEEKDEVALRMLYEASLITFILKDDGRVFAKPSGLGAGLKAIAFRS